MPGMKTDPQHQNLDWRKRGQAFVFLAWAAIDTIAILLSLYLSFKFNRAYWSDQYLITLLYALLMFLSFADMKNLYRPWRSGLISLEIQSALESWVMVFAMTFVTGYLWPEVALPQDIMLAWLLITPVFLVVSRIFGRNLLRSLRQRGFNQHRFAIAGNAEISRHLSNVMAANPWMGYRQIGLFTPITNGMTSTECTKARVGTLDALAALAYQGKLDTIFIGLAANEPADWAEDLVRQLSDTTVSVYLVWDRRHRQTGKADIPQGLRMPMAPNLTTRAILHRCWIEIGGIPALSIYESPFSGINALVKRLEDVALSSLALILMSLPMLAIALKIKLSSPGRVLFKQRRYGLDGNEIIVWKFRSMTAHEDGERVEQARKNDPRVTSFGRFLRRTSLDELPQFINVLQGSMSIVGPRPHAVAHNEQYRKLVSGYMLRHKVKPGITGLAQIRGYRGETDTLEKMARRVESDLEYIRSWSIWLDIKILILTVFKGFTHKNAY